ncbi:MAG TPA: class I SAM-dependent methyltransferase [Nostocaceae cyanobacterium]|nr:class I SAM-dependent methyltransferase [Nostocaceae cyanobacterium]
MTEPQDPVRQKIKQLANESLDHPTAWFETVYARSQGDTNQIPWAKLTPHPYLQNWLDTYTPTSEKPTAVVIGCGLGDDAEAIAAKGYQVTAFDISPTAVNWCQQRFPNSQVNYTVADLLAIPPQWQQAFDLVFECRTIQSLPLSIRSTVIEAVASLVAVGGTLLLVSAFRETEAQPEGPPWPLSASEFSQFIELELTEVSRFSSSELNLPHLRIEYQKQSPK